MDLRFPTGGGGFLDGWLDTTHGATIGPSGDSCVTEVTPERLAEALAELAAGHVEYLVVVDGDAFVQAAGQGDGPYELELNPGDVERQVQVPGGTTAAGVAHALHGFLARDPAWAQAFTWAPSAIAAPPPRRRWFGRR